MDSNKIYGEIEKSYNSSGKGFITHLMKSFFPESKVKYVAEKTVDMKALFCCVTRHKLLSKADVIAKKLKDVYPEYMDKIVPTLEHKSDRAHIYYSSKGRISLAITSIESTKYICQDAWEELEKFKINLELKKAQEIANKLVPNILKPNNPIVVKKPFNKNNSKQIQKQKDNNRRYQPDRYVLKEHKPITFGDLDSLKDLKEKLEQEEKKKQ